VIYLTLDDLNKLYGLDGKLLKKLKKKRKKRKSQKGIKFEKIKDSSQMPGVQYFNNNSNMDTQFLKDQIKSLQDKQNKLLITDMQPNLVNNRLLMDLKQDNEKVKQGMVKMYTDASDTFNYIYDQFEELKSNNKNNDAFTVNYNDNIGDFSNSPNWTDPKKIDEEKQTYNTLSQKSESYRTPDYLPYSDDLSSLFYDDNTSDVMVPPTEDKPVNDDQQPEIIKDDTIDETQEEMISGPVIEPPPFIEEEKEIISDPVVEDKPKIKKKKKSFKPPQRIAGEHGNAYNARVEHFRKVHDGEEVTEWAIKRYGKIPNK
jgi:hypothetical protein